MTSLEEVPSPKVHLIESVLFNGTVVFWKWNVFTADVGVILKFTTRLQAVGDGIIIV